MYSNFVCVKKAKQKIGQCCNAVNCVDVESHHFLRVRLALYFVTETVNTISTFTLFIICLIFKEFF